jgi:hypothetical protein
MDERVPYDVSLGVLARLMNLFISLVSSRPIEADSLGPQWT